MLSKLFVLLGRSNSGKDTIFNMIMNDKELSELKNIKQFTTRPRRENESDISYNFISEDEFMKIRDDLIEFRSYNAYIDDTNKNIWYYGTPKIESEFGLGISSSHTLDSTLKLFLEYRYAIKPIYLYCDDNVLKERALSRGDNVVEAERRFISDLNNYKYIDSFARQKIESFYDMRPDMLYKMCENTLIIDTTNKSKEYVFGVIKDYILTTGGIKNERKNSEI